MRSKRNIIAKITMKAVILAAGVGSRMRSFTGTTHKTLLKIGNKTILEMMIDTIQSVRIREIAIVTGHLEEQIKHFVEQRFPSLNVCFVRNEKYKTTNTGYSLMLAKNFAYKSDFVKFDADVVFEKEILQRLIQNTFPNCLCVDTHIHLASEEVKVKVNEQSAVLQVGKKIPPKEASGESIGIEKISKNASIQLFSLLEKLMQNEKNYQEYYDDSYTTLVTQGIPFYAVDVSGFKWVEVDTIEDYLLAEKLFLKKF